MLARKIILGFGFAVLMPMLIHYGIDAFVPSASVGERDSEREIEQGQRETRYRQQRQTLLDGIHNATGEESAKAQQHLAELEKRHQQEELEVTTQRLAAARQRNESGRYHFFIGVPTGIVVTLLGSLIPAQAIGGGLMLGGIFTFTDGCVGFWGDLPHMGRFLVLLVAFGVLLWIGYQRLAERKPKSSP